MKNTENFADFISEIEDNIGIVHTEILDHPEAYPYLHKRMMAHNGAIFDKLIHLLEYTASLHVRKDKQTKRRQYVVTDASGCVGGKWRGWEMRISYAYMRMCWGGTFDTWKHAIKYLCSVGLMYPWIPSHHKKEENTPAQEYSKKLADDKSGKPVTWYGFPRYKGSTLDDAEERAELLSELSLDGISEDSVREALGNDAPAAAFAQRAFDSVSGGHMFKSTEERRDVLRAVCLELIQAKRYAVSDTVLVMAWERYTGMDGVEWPDMLDKEAFKAFKNEHKKYFDSVERDRFSLTWDAYRPTLRRQYHFRIGRPSKAEHDGWHLPNYKTIIRPSKGWF